MISRPRLSNQRQHFEAHLPPATHRVEATCREVECESYQKGWITAVPVNSEQDLFLSQMTNRKYVKRVDGQTANYIFYPGQRCFVQHTRSLDRPPILVHRKEWNGSRRRVGFAEWQDRFATSLEEIRRERGK